MSIKYIIELTDKQYALLEMAINEVQDHCLDEEEIEDPEEQFTHDEWSELYDAFGNMVEV